MKITFLTIRHAALLIIFSISILFIVNPISAVTKQPVRGDVNGDGLVDVVIVEAAPEAISNDEFAAESIYVFYGNRNVKDIKPRPDVIISTLFNKGIDTADISTSCDYNGDNFSDITVPTKEGGDVRIYFGRKSLNKVPDVIFKQPKNSPQDYQFAGFGRSTACVGDVNGDRFDDLAIGVPYRKEVTSNGTAIGGQVWIYFGGKKFQQFDKPGVILEQEMTLLNDGETIESFGDINGDKKSDIIVGGREQWLVYLGGTQQVIHPVYKFNKSSVNPVNPEQVRLGDINGDGKDEIIVSSGKDDLLNHSIRILLGVVQGGEVKEIVIPNPNPSKQFGSAPLVKDINGDGSDDIIVGDPLALIEKTKKYGKVYVYFGKHVSGVLPLQWNKPDVELWNTRDARVWEFGSGISSPGDVNGDGFADLLLRQAIPVKNGQTLYLGGKKISFNAAITFQWPYLPQLNKITSLPLYITTAGGGSTFIQKINSESVVQLTKAGEELVNAAPNGKKYQTIWYTTQKAGSVSVHEKILSTNKDTVLLTYKHNNPRCDMFEGAEPTERNREYSMPPQCVPETGVSLDGKWIAYRDRVGLKLYERATQKTTVLKQMSRRCPELNDNQKDFISALYCIDAVIIDWSPNNSQFVVQNISRTNLNDKDLISDDSDPSKQPTLEEAEIWTLGAGKPQLSLLNRLEKWSWSDDGKSLLLNYSLNDFKTVEWVADTQKLVNRKKILQSQLKGRFYISSSAVSPNKQLLGLIIFEEEGSKFRGYVAQYDQRNNILTKLREIGGVIDQTYSTIAWTPDGKYLLYGNIRQNGGNIYGINPRTKENVIISRDQTLLDVVTGN